MKTKKVKEELDSILNDIVNKKVFNTSDMSTDRLTKANIMGTVLLERCIRSFNRSSCVLSTVMIILTVVLLLTTLGLSYEKIIKCWQNILSWVAN